MQINFLKREIVCKIVYYGPGMSGKTTNLQRLNEKTPVEHRSNLTSIATEGERTLFFDYMPLNLGKVGEMNAKLQLYTVPGQVYYNATRKLVLQGTDGVVFVADSQKEKLDENIESLQNLMDNLKEYEVSIKDIPLVIQFNKRDLPNAERIDLLEQNINQFNVPTTQAVASQGEGVVETLKLIASLVLTNLNKKQNAAISLTRSQNTGTSISLQASKSTPAKPTILQRIRQTGGRYLEWIGWKERVLASIDDVNITKSNMINFYNQQVRMLNTKPSTNGHYERLTQPQKEYYLNQLINHYLLLEKSKKKRITVSKQEVDKYMTVYANKFGSEEKCKAYLTQRQLTLEDIRNGFIKQILTNKMIKIQIPNFQDELKSDENELLDYYCTHPEEFDGPFEKHNKEIEKALHKEKKSKLNQKLLQILRSHSTIKTYPKNL